jgi:hypothetical protein
MTFGYIAGRHAAGVTDYEESDQQSAGDVTPQTTRGVPTPAY